MKKFKSLAACALVSGAVCFVLGCKSAAPAPAPAATTTSVEPYPLKKCIVTDEPLEAGKDYTFVRDGHQIKLCCKDCLADFDKDPKKYMAKLSAGK